MRWFGFCKFLTYPSAYDLLEGFVLLDNLIDCWPIGESTNITVIDKDVGVEFARVSWYPLLVEEVGVLVVDRIEIDTSFLAPFDCILQKVTCPHGPQHHLITLRYQPAEYFGSVWPFLPYFGVLMLTNGTVEIYCDNHSVCMLRDERLYLVKFLTLILVAITIAIAVTVAIAVTIAVTIATSITLVAVVSTIT